MNSDNLKYVLREFAERPLPTCKPCERFPDATGRLLFHEHAPGIVRRIPGASPAWRRILEQKAGV